VVLTVATPTSVFTFSMVPPAALITRCAEAADAPALYRTTYSLRAVGRFDDAVAVGAASAGTTNAATMSAAPAQPVATRDLCFTRTPPQSDLGAPEYS
jgi:hypothetical protein